MRFNKKNVFSIDFRTPTTKPKPPNMKALFFALIIITSLYNSGIAQVKFEKLTLAEALAKADAENKKVFVDVYTTWCGPCKRLDKDVFSDKTLGERMSKDYICLKLDNENNEDRVNFKQYGITAYPTLLILEAKTGAQLLNSKGYMDLNGFNSMLDTQLPKEQQPIYIAYKALADHPEDKAIWRKHLPLILKQDYEKFDSLAQVYVDRFGFDEINDDLDRDIFSYAELPLTSLVVQDILKKGIDGDYGIYTYLDYFQRATKAEYMKARSEEARTALREKASKTYDAASEALYGDIILKESFMDEIFPKEEPVKVKEPEKIEEVDNPKAEVVEELKPTKKKKKKRKTKPRWI